MELFKLFGTIAINNSEANESIDETTEKAEKSETRMTDAFKKIGGAIATYLTVSAIKQFGSECINMASDVEEMENKFNVVFSGMEDDVSSWADEYASAIGRNKNTIKGYLADNQNMFVGMGMTREEGAKLSENMVQLALDLASFNNLNETDAVNAFSKAIMGETESAKSLGAVLNENTRAMAMEQLGYKGKFEELTEAEKMEVNYQAILMQSADAVGDCERSLDSYKGRTIQLNSAKEKLYETIGTMLLPMMTSFTQGLTVVVTAIQTTIEWFQKNQDIALLLAIAIGTITTAILAYNIAQNALTIVTTIATTATTAFGAVMAFITSPITLVVLAIGALIAIVVVCIQHWDEIKAKTVEIWTSICDFFGVAVDKIKQAFAPIGQFFKDVWQGIKDTFGSVAEWFGNVFKNAWEGVKAVFSTGGKIFTGITEGIVSFFKTIVNGIIGGINNVISIPFNAINGILQGIHDIEILGVSPFGWVSPFSVPQIPMLEKGGVVDGSTLANVGEAGKEAIIPLERNTEGLDLIADKLSERMSNAVLQEKLNSIISLLEKLTGMNITLDSGALVGGLAPAMDTALGNIYEAKGRGGRSTW